MDNDALLFQLRTIARAYPADVFPPFSEEEREMHTPLITQASGCMGRHLAQFITQAADEIERLSADAERYRWLRAHGSCPFAETDDAWDSPERLDAEIDVRIAEGS